MKHAESLAVDEFFAIVFPAFLKWLASSIFCCVLEAELLVVNVFLAIDSRAFVVGFGHLAFLRLAFSCVFVLLFVVSYGHREFLEFL